MMKMMKIFVSILVAFTSLNIHAAEKGSTTTLLMIGASYSNGKTRLDDNHKGSFLGLAVGSGAYLSLGDALIRERKLNGLVVNEASVGSTTFDRFSCAKNDCLTFGRLLGYETQFKNALTRTAIYNPASPGEISSYNAKYLLIGFPNDCIHSDSFGIPQVDTQPCSLSKIHQSVDIIIKIAKKAEYLGITVIIPILPKYKDLNLNILKQGLGLQWVASEQDYSEIRSIYKERFKNELANALIINIWKKFKHRGDGIHPNRKTMKMASRKIAKVINKHASN